MKRMQVGGLLACAGMLTMTPAVTDSARPGGAEQHALNELSQLSFADLLGVPVRSASLHEERLMVAPSSITVFERRELLETGVPHRGRKYSVGLEFRP